MKKHYNVSRLTDELSNSVFFQKPAQPGEPRNEKQSDLAPKHRITKASEPKSVKAPNNQPTKELKQESSKAGSNYSAKALKQQATKHLKHFSSYLTPESWKRIKMLATERELHDYEILQNAVDLYFANLDKSGK